MTEIPDEGRRALEEDEYPFRRPGEGAD